jgi:hypothetical protein
MLIMVVVIVVFLTVPGRMPQYEQPGPGVLLLGIVLNVRLLLPLLLLLSLVLLLLLALVLALLLVLSLLLLLLLEQTTPGGHGPVLELLLVVCSRGSVVRVWRTFSPIPVGRLYASRVNAIARIKNTVIVRRPSLRVIKINGGKGRLPQLLFL